MIGAAGKYSERLGAKVCGVADLVGERTTELLGIDKFGARQVDLIAQHKVSGVSVGDIARVGVGDLGDHADGGGVGHMLERKTVQGG